MKTSESIKNIATALSKFQEEVKQPEKSADNPFFKSKYVPLESVVETINLYGPKNGLSFTQWPSVNEGNRIGVSTLLMHSSGEWIEFDPIFMKSEKDTAQGAGSVITYLKRYSLSAVYGITSDEDDDGNTATGLNQQKNPPPKQTGPKMASAAQLKSIGAKVKEIAERGGSDQTAVFKKAQDNIGINKSTRELTADEAGKFIEYLIALK